MKHLRAGTVIGMSVLFAGVVWNMLGEYRTVIIALAVATTIVVAIIDWYTEQER